MICQTCQLESSDKSIMCPFCKAFNDAMPTNKSDITTLQDIRIEMGKQNGQRQTTN